MFFIKLPFLTTNLTTMLFAIRLVQLAQLKPIFLSDCSLILARVNRRPMVRSGKHGISVTPPWVILHLTMQPARLRVVKLSCLAI